MTWRYLRRTVALLSCIYFSTGAIACAGTPTNIIFPSAHFIDAPMFESCQEASRRTEELPIWGLLFLSPPQGYYDLLPSDELWMFTLDEDGPPADRKGFEAILQCGNAAPVKLPILDCPEHGTSRKLYVAAPGPQERGRPDQTCELTLELHEGDTHWTSFFVGGVVLRAGLRAALGPLFDEAGPES